jgi:hypothetical protein
MSRPVDNRADDTEGNRKTKPDKRVVQNLGQEIDKPVSVAWLRKSDIDSFKDETGK